MAKQVKRSTKPKKTPRAAAKAKPIKGKSAGQKKSSKRARKGSASEPSLGRPKVTGEEMLFMLFKEDYEARQIFDFLRVERVKDLEQYSPQQIVRKLSRPITETVDRIRRKLADKNRCLRDDAEFASEQKSNE